MKKHKVLITLCIFVLVATVSIGAYHSCHIKLAPDFRTALKASHPELFNIWGSITKERAAQITSLDLGRPGLLIPGNPAISNIRLSSLKGIEYFTSLTYLNVGWHRLTELDVSGLTELRYLSAPANQLTEIDVSHNTELLLLDVSYNRIIKMDVSNNKKLQYLGVYGDGLAEIDVSNNIELLYLNIVGNFTEIDVFNNTKLQTLYISSFDYIGIDINKAPDNFRADSHLTEIDISNNKELRHLRVGGDLTEIDLSYNTNLEELRLSSMLTELDLSNNGALETLEISYNLLTKLDLSNNIKLRDIDVSHNRLTELIMPDNIVLEAFWVNDNLLTGLDVSKINLALRPVDVQRSSSFTVLPVGIEISTVQETFPAGQFDVRNNKMDSLDDVIGWGNSPFLVLEDNFLFFPQAESY